MLAKDKPISSKHLAKRSNLVSLFQVLIHLGLVFLPILLVIIFPFSFYNIFSIIIFGLLMNGVINMMHECAHYHLFDKRIYNVILGQYILGPLFFANFETYRQRHWDHHKYLGSEDDTKDAYLVNVRGKNVLLYFLICLTGIEALKKFFGQLKKKPEEVNSEKQGMAWVLRLFFFHALFALVLLVLAYLFHGNWASAFMVSAYVYIVVYLYSIMSITIFIATLRAIAEHQVIANDVVREGHASLRNFECYGASRIIFGSYGFGEHLTHHQNPAIPYYNLKEATAELSKNDPKYAPKDDYMGIIIRIVKSS